MQAPLRTDRRFFPAACSSGRTVFQRDRDRLLYTTALRRLAGVTQVIAPDEGHVVHNRLTHVLEVAQIGRRIAEKLLREQLQEAAAVGGLDPDVVESAALAHDLGHPPFGHIAEEQLDELLLEKQIHDGFEGNAQSFRVVTKLCVRRPNVPGLDLSRATLGATLKYPWARKTTGAKHKKFGYYSSEDEDYGFARALEKHPERQTLEASLMDLADDIAYSLSDLEDFIRAGKIPLGKLVWDPNELRTFIAAAHQQISKKYSVTTDELSTLFSSLLKMMPIEQTYAGTKRERANIRNITGYLMDTYVKSVGIEVNPDQDGSYIRLSRKDRLEIALLKHLTFYYVICDPSLAILQRGQRAIIRGLFNIFCEAAMSPNKKERGFFPQRLTEALDEISPTGQDEVRKAEIRSISDFIAGMSDREAVELYQRLHGFSARSLVRTAL